jgi:hypothetical protein
MVRFENENGRVINITKNLTSIENLNSSKV